MEFVDNNGPVINCDGDKVNDDKYLPSRFLIIIKYKCINTLIQLLRMLDLNMDLGVIFLHYYRLLNLKNQNCFI